MPARMDSRLIVILNDNDMSIAPPVGAMSAYLARLVSGAHLPDAARHRQAARQASAQARSTARVTRAEEYARGFVTGGTLFEELGFYYVGPIDGHNLDHLLPVLKNVRDAQHRPDARPRRDPEGQGLRARRGLRRQVSWRQQVRRRHRHAGQGRRPTRPAYTKVFAESLIKEARKDDKIVAITAAMPSGTGLDLFGKRIPDAHLRCRHRRAARGDVRGRPGHGGLQAVLRDLFDLPAARLRPGRPRRGDPEPARALRDRPRRPRRRRRRRPMPGSFDVAYLGCLPEHGRHGRRRRGRAGAHGRDRRGASTTARSPSAIRAARASASTCRKRGVPLEIGKGRIVREGTARGAAVARHAAGRMPEGRRRAGQPRAFRPRSPMPASPSRSTRN